MHFAIQGKHQQVSTSLEGVVKKPPVASAKPYLAGRDAQFKTQAPVITTLTH